MRKGNIYFNRENHTEHYTCISNKCLQDTRLSMKARGLIVQILSLPNTWGLYKDKLQEYNNNARTSIDSAIEELKTLGYLKEIKGKGKSITYVVNETPEGTIGIFDIKDTQNVQCNVDFDYSDVQNQHSKCTKQSSCNVQNEHLLNTNLNNNKLTTTKAVSQSLFPNEKLKKSIEETYGYVFSEDFYQNLFEIEIERGIKPLEYVNWLITEKGKNADSILNYVYKSVGNLNIINEYCRYKKSREEQVNQMLHQEETIICPECNHKFKSIDFITRKCECGLSLNEIMARKGGINE